MTREEAWRRAKGYLYDALSGEEADEIIKALEPSRDMEEIEEIINCDADAEIKLKMISNILTAKPHYFEKQEPKTGRWILWNVSSYDYTYKCDRCKNIVRHKSKYCPNCGVKMGGEYDK